ncbi:helix-turn-helix domain-containing protein [Vibrio harveyi]|uniref:helix-turn-helix domain-containing protein n=1 Tax=Vibrio harveyi TaxID=669 RepID=UPI00217D5E0F|nr:helix-turn-helix domain-containing protein [Vibrio harveyi]
MGVHVTQGSVSQWLKRGSGVPPKHALFVSALSGVHVSDLCPDIYPKSLFADLTIEQIKEYAHEKSRDCQTENG